jgi:hypothetical protein
MVIGGGMCLQTINAPFPKAIFRATHPSSTWSNYP